MQELYSVIEDNDDFIAVNKHHGILSQSGKDSSPSVIEKAKEEYSGSFFHLLNRIDRPVGGLLLIAKSRYFSNQYLELQEKGAIEKRYLALVEGVVAEPKLMLRHYLKADRRRKKAIVSENEDKNSKKVSLSLKVLKRFDRYTALEIYLAGGKFHQIRAQLGYWGHPIRGDVKYGARRGHRDKSIDLHAYQLSWTAQKGDAVNLMAPPLKSDTLWNILKELLK